MLVKKLPMKDILYVNANFQLGRGWDVPHPDDYDVQLIEPLRKSSGNEIGFLTLDHLSILVVLQQSGLTDWVVGKTYDQLWQYLKTLLTSLPKSPLTRGYTIEVRGNEGNVRSKVEFNHIDEHHIQQMEIDVRNEILKTKSGDVREINSIQIKMGHN